ncbi:MAG: urea transporter [Myxococcales bacterium]|nr:urea transporter [Myxococcales bacterium]
MLASAADGLLLSPTTGAWLLGLFSLLWIALGLHWGRRARSLDGFMVAGRNVGLALGTATAMATWVTSNTTMLAPQLALELGVWGMLAYSTASLGLLLFAPLARRIRAVMPHGYTSAEFIELRYGRAAWAIFLVLSLFYALTWLISMGMAGGLLIEALTGIEYRWGMTVVLGVCVAYTVSGGLYAVIGTDFLQSLIVLVGLVVVGGLVLWEVSVAEVHASLVERRPMLLDLLYPAALMALFNNLLFGLGEVFHSNVWWSRAFAMRPGVGAKAYTLAGLLWWPVPVVAGFLGLAAPALDIGISRPDMVAPVLAGTLLGELGAVLVFVVVFASIASSIDSLLAATSDLLTKELVARRMPGASEARLRAVAAWTVLGTGVLAWVACLPKVGTLATVLFFAGPMVASMIWPVVAGLYWRRATAAGAVGGMVAGTAVGLWVYVAIGWYAASLAGALVSAVVVIATTLRSRERFDFARLAEGRS